MNKNLLLGIGLGYLAVRGSRRNPLRKAGLESIVKGNLSDLRKDQVDEAIEALVDAENWDNSSEFPFHRVIPPRIRKKRIKRFLKKLKNHLASRRGPLVEYYAIGLANPAIWGDGRRITYSENYHVTNEETGEVFIPNHVSPFDEKGVFSPDLILDQVPMLEEELLKTENGIAIIREFYDVEITD